MDLAKIRRQIDVLDGKMKDLFLERVSLSGQVAEAKKISGGDVYVPAREQEVLASRSEGMQEEYRPHCQAFFRQLMGISRTYQYARFLESDDALSRLPDQTGDIFMCFSCEKGSVQLAACLNAVVTAGLSVKTLEANERDGGLDCQVCLSGDFTDGLARASILQILRENKNVTLKLIS